MLHRFTATLLALTLAAVFASPSATASPADWEELQRRTGALAGLPLNTSMLSPAAAAAEAGSNPADMLAWIHARFAVDAYEGTTRGVRGTLFSRSGSPLDLSLLLGAMLESAGHSWRLAQADLGGREAAALFSLLTGEATFTLGAAPPETERYAADRDVRRAALMQRHTWVQVRERDGWTDLDPSLPLGPGERLTESERTLSPGELTGSQTRHATVQLHYRTTGTDGGVLLTRRVPIDELAYRNISIAIARNGDRGDYIPRLEFGEVRETGSAFSGQGLRRLWVEVIVEGPRAPRAFQSPIVFSETGENLTDDHIQLSVLLLSGDAGRDWVQAVLRTLGSELEPRVATLRDRMASPDPDDPGDRTLLAELSPQISGIMALSFAHRSDVLQHGLARTLGVRAWWSEPRVLVSSVRRQGSRIQLDLDLLQNRPEAVPATGLPPLFAGAFQVLRGRTDAALHRALLQAMLPTGTTLPPHPDPSGNWTAANSPQAAIFTGNALPPLLRDHLRHAVPNDGIVAAIPHGDETPRIAWLIDSATGHIGPLHHHLVHSPGARHSASDTTVRAGEATAQALAGLLQFALGSVDGSDDGHALACEAQCALNAMAPRLCRDDEERPTLNVSNCLGTETSERDTRGPVAALRVTRGGCFRSAEPAICGSLMSNLALSGRLQIQRTLAAPLGGHFVEAEPIVPGRRCTCD